MAIKVNPKVFEEPSIEFIKASKFYSLVYNSQRVEFLENFSGASRANKIKRIRYSLLMRLFRCIEINEYYHWSERHSKIRDLDNEPY